MNINFYKGPDKFEIWSKELYEYCSQFRTQEYRFVPKELKDLNTELLCILFRWLIKGDGYKSENYTAYYSVSKKLIDDVQEIIIKLGLSGNVHSKKQKQSVIRGRIVTPRKTLYEIRIRKSKFKRLHGASKKPYIFTEHYIGKVYCVTVPKGVIKVRRNGKELWSGNSLRGSNPKGIVFSEYAYQHEAVYPTLRPILVANDGWAVFISTPFGENHFHQLYEVAKNSDDWFDDFLTVEDTDVVSLEMIEKEEAEGLMSPDKIRQEYYCDFSIGAVGSYYSSYLNRLELANQIGPVPWEPSFKVHTAWDLGMSDSTVILFFQIIGNCIKVIDVYSNESVGLEHYIHVVLNKEYTYGKHLAPHDIRVRDYSSGGLSRWDKALEMGLRFNLAPNMSIIDGIETVRTTLPRIWIDKDKGKKLITAIRDYRKEYDSKLKKYKPRPLHDHNSHYCFTSDTLVWTRSGMRPIISLTNKDEVMTLEGWKKCTKAYKIQTNAKLVEVTFRDGTKVKCTPEHKFLTENGWKYAKNLKKGSKIRSSLMKPRNYLEKHILSAHQENTLDDGLDSSIEMYGLQRLVQFLINIISTIKTEILPITISGTSSACLYPSTNQYQSPTLREYLKRRGMLQPNGMDLRKDENGTKNMLKRLKHGRNSLEKNEHAPIVGNSSQPWLEKGTLPENSVMQTAKPLLVESVLEMKERQDVYDIGVPEVGHFSLSNGAIVHNCDALRYLCVGLPQIKSNNSTAAELDKRYYQAMYGHGHGLPEPFRKI